MIAKLRKTCFRAAVFLYEVTAYVFWRHSRAQLCDLKDTDSGRLETPHLSGSPGKRVDNRHRHQLA